MNVELNFYKINQYSTTNCRTIPNTEIILWNVIWFILNFFEKLWLYIIIGVLIIWGLWLCVWLHLEVAKLCQNKGPCNVMSSACLNLISPLLRGWISVQTCFDFFKKFSYTYYISHDFKKKKGKRFKKWNVGSYKKKNPPQTNEKLH